MTLLPASCTATWSSGSVSIPSSKIIILDGNSATITQSGTAPILTVNANSAGVSEIKNFTFNSSVSSFSGSGNGVVNAGTCTYSAASPNSSYRIHHNTFTVLDTSPFTSSCHGRGLIDHNVFNDPSSVNNEGPTAFGSGTAAWTEAITPGGVDAVYYEDNSFSGGGGANKTFMVSGGRVVFRFNTFQGKVIDVHGNTGVKGRWWEVYKNNFNRNSNAPSWMIFRGGSGIVFGNTRTQTGGSGSEGIQMYHDFDSPDGCAYPGLYQIGRGQNQIAYPAYAFLNALPYLSVGLNNECAGLLQFNRDAYTDEGITFNGTVGVGSGTLASRSATCTAGVAYWATDQGGNWDTLHGGANDGQLYKCTATNTWTLYMTPAIYPHPLQATSYAATCSNTDVQTAIAAASDGWTVQIPTGNCTWTGAVSTNNKRLTIQGTGNAVGQTVLTLSGTNRLNINNNVGQTITVKNMRILGQANDFGLIRITGTIKDFRLTGLYVNWTATGDAPDGAIKIIGDIYGLIDHNTFAPSTACIGFRSAIGIESDSVVTAYTRASILGTGNAIYIEDNTFTQTAYCGSTHAVWAQTGGSYVARYNSLTNWTFDVHGPCSWYGARQFEIYENDFIASSSIFATCVLRGGSGVYYNNRITTNGNSVGNHRIRMQEVDNGTLCNAVTGGNCYACIYPWNYQLGRGTNNALDPIYFWNNRKDGALINVVRQNAATGNPGECACHLGNDMDFYAQQNRDWYDSASTAKPGYTAYTYPHPLQGVAVIVDTTPPAAPTGVTISQLGSLR